MWHTVDNFHLLSLFLHSCYHLIMKQTVFTINLLKTLFLLTLLEFYFVYFQEPILTFRNSDTAWKLSKYGVFSGPFFPASGLNTERYGVSLRIQSECGKIRTRITPNMDTFHALSYNFWIIILYSLRKVMLVKLVSWPYMFQIKMMIL